MMPQIVPRGQLKGMQVTPSRGRQVQEEVQLWLRMISPGCVRKEDKNGVMLKGYKKEVGRSSQRHKALRDPHLKSPNDAHPEVLAIVEARTIVHRDTVAPGREESLITLAALRAGSRQLHHFLNP